MLYGAKWRWSWRDNRISNLWCYCPTCDAQLVPFDSLGETNFLCERCPPLVSDRDRESFGVVVMVRPVEKDYVMGAAEREIWRRIRTQENVASSG